MKITKQFHLEIDKEVIESNIYILNTSKQHLSKL